MRQRILIVDHDPKVRRSLRSILEDRGAEVVETDSARNAIDAAGLERFDLVIADANLPGVDGVAMTRRLRLLPGWQHTPILILSSPCAGPSITDGRRAGVSAWMSKSIQPILLLRAIDKATHRASVRRCRARSTTEPLVGPRRDDTEPTSPGPPRLVEKSRNPLIEPRRASVTLTLA